MGVYAFTLISPTKRDAQDRGQDREGDEGTRNCGEHSDEGTIITCARSCLGSPSAGCWFMLK